MTDVRAAENAVDSDLLIRRLRESVRGPVSIDPGTRGMYTMDASNYRRVPPAVVIPSDTDDVVAAMAVCRELGTAVVPRGGGTSIAGNSTGGGVVIDFSRHLNKIIDIDPAKRLARVQPGVVLDTLRNAASQYGLTFGPDPSTHSRCTLGGMIGNNACGSHSVAWGKTADNVSELDVLLYDGTRMRVGSGGRSDVDSWRTRPGREGQIHAAVDDLVQANLAHLRQGFPAIPRRVSGYSLDELLPERGFGLARSLVGTEGSCVTVLEATVNLVRTPGARVLLVLGYADDIAAADAVPSILPHGPLTVEGMDERIAKLSADRGVRSPVELPAGGAWLFIEIGGDTVDEATGRALAIASEFRGEGVTSVVVAEPAHQKALWRIREEGSGTSTRGPGGVEAWPGWEDAAVPPAQLGSYLRGFRALLDKNGYHGITYGHFGEGCMHVRIDFDLLTKPGIAKFRSFIEDASDLVVSHGGSLSGEHGDGPMRSEMLPRMYRPEIISMFERFKGIWDPDDRMNPGVIVRPQKIDENLRFETIKRDLPVHTIFSYPHDSGDFAQAMRRCVGVSKCRNTHTPGGVMCPSYQVTGEEKHSTRGRARLLFEMLSGDVIKGGWKSKEVKDALDLCLSCKGCKSDCPVDVDMATYKAEFLHHHYKGRIRPGSHYSMGFLPLLSRFASVAPRLVNAVSQNKALARVLKALGGIDQKRRIPLFAKQSFVRWHKARPRPALPAEAERPKVVLFPDTFDNYFTPDVGKAATEVLESAGFEVIVPTEAMCCGLTWVSTGQLRTAQRVLRKTLRVLRPYLDQGIPVVGMEPSCTAMFRNDLPELMAGDDSAALLAKHTKTFAEVLDSAPNWEPAKLDATSLRQTHCHQHAVLGAAADARVLAKAGVDDTKLDSGCCGLAGNFGFERGHYDVSKAIGERVLLPAVREAGEDVAILADGFSCRTQIDQETDRQAVHLAELLNRARTDQK